MRDIIVQLKMIQCGYFGPAEATAGAYIASHRKNLGSYFENSLNNEWPYQPLHRKPNELETQFNEYLMKMTEELSNGTLKNISILDLPSFGSHISGSYLDKEQTSESNWPIEQNFAIYNQYRNDTERALAFSQYKRQFELWKHHMDSVESWMEVHDEVHWKLVEGTLQNRAEVTLTGKWELNRGFIINATNASSGFAIANDGNDPGPWRVLCTDDESGYFIIEKATKPGNFLRAVSVDHITIEPMMHTIPNEINPFNFTQHIVDDFSTFLKVYAGSYHTALRDSSGLWNETAKKVFGQTLDEKLIKKNGLYDKLIMDCSFKEKLIKKAGTDVDVTGGCDDFYQTLTSNGLCQSFNGLNASSTWRNSSVVHAFDKTFHTRHSGYKFGGTGSNEGI